MRKAFTLIEIILTLVILSIVSYIATGLIADTYIGYNQANAVNKANLKLEIALTEISNRLEYALKDTIIKKSSINGNFKPIQTANDDYDILEWIGYDKDGFEANDMLKEVNGSDIEGTVSDQPGWSGFCNIDTSTNTRIFTPGSYLPIADETIKRLSNDNASLSNSTVGIFFPGNYDYTNVGYNHGTASGVAVIQNYGKDSNNIYYFNLTSPVSRITEHYKLAWSAYAVVPENYNDKEKTFDLTLKYDFRPWLNEEYNDANTKSALLVKNVTVFRTYATENRIHIKICVKEKFGATKNAAICKEKVVFK